MERIRFARVSHVIVTLALICKHAASAGNGVQLSQQKVTVRLRVLGGILDWDLLDLRDTSHECQIQACRIQRAESWSALEQAAVCSEPLNTPGFHIPSTHLWELWVIIK